MTGKLSGAGAYAVGRAPARRWAGIRGFALTVVVAMAEVVVLSADGSAAENLRSDDGVPGPVPSFARKYNLSCNACHTREPRLNPFGQRFQENGYQLPGTQDGGVTEKDLLGGPLSGVNLDQVSNYLAARLRAEVQQGLLREEVEGVSEKADIVVPNVVNIFLAGAATKNISFYFETEFAPAAEEGEAAVEFERVMLILTNLGRYQLVNLRIGRLDPSAFFAFPTHRQHMNPIFAIAEAEEFPPEIGRIPVIPLAFTAKMFGLTRGPTVEGTHGFSILPFEPFLFNSPAQTGAILYGRPFGENLLYQLGVSQDETAEDEPETRFDYHGMLRFDLMPADYMAFQVSGFYYVAPDAARPTLAPMGNVVFAQPVDWTRWGVGARLHYRFFDLYAAAVWDEIDEPAFPAGTPLALSEWDTQGLGVSVEGDWLVNQDWMVGIRWDLMDPGGLVRLPPALQGEDPEVNQDVSFLGGIVKFYPVPNVGLYGRGHVNLTGSEELPEALGGEQHPARNLQFIYAIGVDMAI